MRQSMDRYVSVALDPSIREMRSLAQAMSTEARDSRVEGATNRVISGLENLPELMEEATKIDAGEGTALPTDDSIDELNDLIGVVSSFTQDPSTRDIARLLIQHAKALQSRLSEEEIMNNVIRPLASQA